MQMVLNESGGVGQVGSNKLKPMLDLYGNKTPCFAQVTAHNPDDWALIRKPERFPFRSTANPYASAREAFGRRNRNLGASAGADPSIINKRKVNVGIVGSTRRELSQITNRLQ